MRRRISVTAALLVLATGLLSAQLKSASDAVVQADDRYLQLMRQPDRASLKELLAKDFVFTNRQGAVLTEDDLLRLPTATTLPKDRKIRLHGDHTAIVTSTLESKDGTVHQLRVWINDGAKWRIAAAQATLVAQPAPK